jgi:hypothetical protein
MPQLLQDPPAGVERDPREDEAWFAELPPDERARLQERWRAQAARDAGHAARDRRRLLRAMGECAGLFLLVLLLALSVRQVLTWRGLLVLPAGAAAGLLVHHWFRDQFGVGLVGLAGVFALAWTAGASGLQLVLAIVAGGVAFGCYGVRRHFRALDGLP